MHVFRHATLLLLLLALGACGFQLRGSVDIPPQWKALYLASPSPRGELASGLAAALSRNGVQWLEAGQANYILQLGDEQFHRRNLSIGANARATEFELKLSTSLQVVNAAGDIIAADTAVTVSKVMTHDPQNVTGKEEESSLLRREMRAELIQQLIRKIRYLATA